MRLRNKQLASATASPTPSTASSDAASIGQTATLKPHANSSIVRRKIIRQQSRFDAIKSHQTLNSPLRSERKSIPVWDSPVQPTHPTSASASIEKRNPLGNTRLSCYKPKIGDKFSLPTHYKSVDDILFLNSIDDDTSAPATQASGIGARIIDRTMSTQMEYSQISTDAATMGNSLRMAQRQFGGDDDDGSCTAQLCTTKSAENILEPNLYEPPVGSGKKPKKPNMLHISDKIRTMSSRTQKLFARIYNGSQSKQQSQSEQASSMGRHGVKAATCRISSPKSRRSLSFGHIPGEDDLKQILKDIDQLDDGDRDRSIHPDTQKPLFANGTISRQQRLPDEPIKSNSDGEDTDSGIHSVNESGQSSIIDNGAEAHEISDDERTLIEAQDINADIDFKFVRIPIEFGCGLGVGLKAVIGDSVINKRVGYHVASIEDGGMVFR